MTMSPATFWNLSNHAQGDSWTEEQGAAAAAWGGRVSNRLVDVPLPQVDPAADSGWWKSWRTTL